MKPTINVSLRVPIEQARLMRKAARIRGQPLATFVRQAAFDVAAEIALRDVQPTEAPQRVTHL